MGSLVGFNDHLNRIASVTCGCWSTWGYHTVSHLVFGVRMVLPDDYRDEYSSEPQWTLDVADCKNGDLL